MLVVMLLGVFALTQFRKKSQFTVAWITSGTVDHVGLYLVNPSGNQVADITVIRNDLNAVVDAILLSRATLAKIRQNLFFAFAYNVLGIPLAAFGMLNPVIAGAAMAASSVSVVTNALLLKRWRPSG